MSLEKNIHGLINKLINTIMKCTNCGEEMRRETIVIDEYDPFDYYGHSQMEEVVFICDECGNEAEEIDPEEEDALLIEDFDLLTLDELVDTL